MLIHSLDNFLINFSFVSILITTLFFWIQFSFRAVGCRLPQAAGRQKEIEFFDNFLVIFCSILILLNFINRWILTNHFPLSNLYESLLFLTLALLLFLIYFQFTLKKIFVAVLILPIVLFINTFATFTLPVEMQQPTSLVPALQSNWLMMHVTIMMLSYAALIFGSLLAITFLIVQYILNDKIKNLNIQNEDFSFSPLAPSTRQGREQGEGIPKMENQYSTFRFLKNIDIIYDLDNLSYRVLTFGFPLLTIGILSGSVWANESWGSYWNWDPKETWALITWFVYAIYLHSRIIKGWSGTKPALIASLGFVTVWICYLGVNVFAKGLHSYGWFFTN
jgi:cytochrome c-type biogenesis protein CcsB